MAGTIRGARDEGCKGISSETRVSTLGPPRIPRPPRQGMIFMGTISIGATTPDLRQRLARRAEFCLTPDEDAVLDLLMEHGYFQVHASTVAGRFGWHPGKAGRVLDDVARVFELTPVLIRSPWGEFDGHQWGEWVESESWPVVAWFDGEQWVDGPPVSSRVPLPTGTARGKDQVPAPVPVPAHDAVKDAASAVKAGTLVKSMEAATGLVRYGVESLGMTAEEARDALIGLSQEGRGATRVNLAQRAQETTATAGPVAVEDMDDRQFTAVMGTCHELNELASVRPDVALGCEILKAVAEYRPVTVTYFHANYWQEQVHGDLSEDPSPEEIHDAVKRAASAGEITWETVTRAIRAARRETVTA